MWTGPHLAFSGASSKSDMWKTGCILIDTGSSSLNVTDPSFFWILKGSSLVWSNLSLGRFILMFFLSR